MKIKTLLVGTALVAMLLTLCAVFTTPSKGQLNAPYAGTNAAVTIDAARLRGYQGGTNPVVGISTSYVFRVTSIGLTNTFTIINGIITAVSQP